MKLISTSPAATLAFIDRHPTTSQVMQHTVGITWESLSLKTKHLKYLSLQISSYERQSTIVWKQTRLLT